MAICVMLSGIVAGLMGSIFALAHGQSVLIAMAMYPLAGIAGVLLLLPAALYRVNATEVETSPTLRQAH